MSLPKDLFLPLNLKRDKRQNLDSRVAGIFNHSVSLKDFVKQTNKDFESSLAISMLSTANLTATNNNNFISIDALAEDLTISSPTGVWAEGQELIIRIKDDGTPRTIAFDSKFKAVGVILPTTTVASKLIYLGIIYNAVDDKFDVIGYNLEV
jgi:hypothetical protein